MSKLTPYKVAQKSLEQLNEWLDRLHKEMFPKDSVLRQYNHELAKDSGVLSTKVKDMLDAMRKYQKDIQSQVSNLTYDQKRQLFLQWFKTISPPHQQEVFDALKELHDA